MTSDTLTEEVLMMIKSRAFTRLSTPPKIWRVLCKIMSFAKILENRRFADFGLKNIPPKMPPFDRKVPETEAKMAFDTDTLVTSEFEKVCRMVIQPP